jgi:hypothetical protein
MIGPCSGRQHQRDLEATVVFVIEMSLERDREHRRLDEPHAGVLYANGV